MTAGDDDQTAAGGDPDLGSPIEELRDVAHQLPDRFAERVARRIERRMLGGDLIELFWSGPIAMLVGFLRWPLDLLDGHRRKREDRS
jgi:hypothetical protein